MATRLRAGGCTSAPDRARAATADHARVHLPVYLCAVAMLRADKIRRPDLLIRCGTDLLGKHRSKLGSGVWDVREQVFTAALDLHYFDVAREQFDALVARFPTSARVKVLEGMMFEAQACSTQLNEQQAAREAEKALLVYDDIINEDPFNAAARKRRVCVQRASGAPQDVAAAIRLMNEYLDMFPQDHDAWKELADMYLEQQQLENAKRALEEWVMLQPVNFQAHLKLADVLYSLDDMPLARKYYAQSLELNDTSNPRAALGMVMCTASINAKGKNKSDAANSKLYQIARLILLEQTVAGSPESSAFKALLNA